MFGCVVEKSKVRNSGRLGGNQREHFGGEKGWRKSRPLSFEEVNDVIEA